MQILPPDCKTLSSLNEEMYQLVLVINHHQDMTLVNPPGCKPLSVWEVPHLFPFWQLPSWQLSPVDYKFTPPQSSHINMWFVKINVENFNTISAQILQSPSTLRKVGFCLTWMLEWSIESLSTITTLTSILLILLKSSLNQNISKHIKTYKGILAPTFLNPICQHN